MDETIQLTLEQTQTLEGARILLHGASTGKLKVSPAIFRNPKSSRSPTSFPPSRDRPYVRFSPFEPTNATPLEIPSSFESVAALEFMGFKKNAAIVLFQDYNETVPAPTSLLTFTTATISQTLRAPELQNLPARQAILTLGISEELKASLMDHRFRQLFASRSLADQLESILCTRGQTLQWLLGSLHHLANKILRRQSQSNNDSPRLKHSSRASRQGPITPKPTVRSNSWTCGLPNEFKSVSVPPPILPDHIVLYKFIIPLDISTMFGANGNLNLEAPKTIGPGDFHQEYDDAWYWTPELSTAIYYQEWTQLMSPYTPTWIIRIQVPVAYIRGLNPIILSSSTPLWSRYVWHCQNGKALPASSVLTEGIDTAKLLIGNISARAPDRDPQEPPRTTTDRDLLTIEGVKATQCVFKVIPEDFEAQVRGNVFVDIHQPAVVSWV